MQRCMADPERVRVSTAQMTVFSNPATCRVTDNSLSLSTTRTRPIGNDLDMERHDRDLWTDKSACLSLQRRADIQTDLFYDHRNSIDAYPKWQACCMRRSRACSFCGEVRISRSSSPSRKRIARCLGRSYARARRRSHFDWMWLQTK